MGAHSDKSHVSMEQRLCHICGATFDTGAILLDRRLAQTLKPHTITGYGRCDDCKSKLAEGRIALVECFAPAYARSKMKPEDAQRTGKIAWLRHDPFIAIFGELPRGTDGKVLSMCFVEDGVIAKLEAQCDGKG